MGILPEFVGICKLVQYGGFWGKFSALYSKGGGGRATLSSAPPPPPNHHNDTIVSMDKGKVTALTLLDLPAAFDTIDYAILTNRLTYWYVLSGQPQIWFSSFLKNGQQSMKSHSHTGLRTGTTAFYLIHYKTQRVILFLY